MVFTFMSMDLYRATPPMTEGLFFFVLSGLVCIVALLVLQQQSMSTETFFIPHAGRFR